MIAAYITEEQEACAGKSVVKFRGVLRDGTFKPVVWMAPEARYSQRFALTDAQQYLSTLPRNQR